MLKAIRNDTLWCRSLSARGTLLLLGCVIAGVISAAALGYRQLRDETEKHITIRLDRAARTAAVTFQEALEGKIAVTRNHQGAPQAYQVVAGKPEEVLQAHVLFDKLVEDIGRVNQGFVNLFAYNAEKKQFERFATNMRGPNGEYVRKVAFGAAHPAFATLVDIKPFIGGSPQAGRMRMAYIAPILGENAEITGAIATDVGWVDDLWRSASELKERMIAWTVVILALIAALGGVILFRAMKPLRVIARYARDVSQNAEVGPVPYLDRNDEVGRLAAGMAQVVEMRHRLETLAYCDPVTGKNNRTRLEEIFGVEMARSKDEGRQLWLLLIGVDGFSNVNDVYGHASGDHLLKLVAEVLHGTISQADTLARISSDEFAVLSPTCQGAKSAALLAQKINDALARPFALPQASVFVSACIGVVGLPTDADTVPEALRNAHIALHKAKSTGRKQTQFFATRLDKEAQRRMELIHELRKAIANDQLLLNFQPQINSRTREVFGIEALCRWQHPEQGMIAPNEFIPVAEESGMIVELGTWVLDQACRTAKAWKDAGFEFRQISVNLSPLQLRQPKFDQLVKSFLVMHDLPPHMLCLEVTESVFIDQRAENVREMLQSLSDIGVCLSLDDFGTGYSSLGYLQGLPFKQLKIDRSFVATADKDLRKQKLLAGIVALGQGLGLQIVAEGAETAAEVAMITDMGCEAVQGFYFSKPVPALMLPIEVARIRSMPDAANVTHLRQAI